MGIEMDELPGQMSLAALEARCTSEINNYRHKEPTNDQYCLEIFHRAIIQHNEQAWELLYRRFHGLVLGWLRRHPRRDMAMRHDSEENYVARAFDRFWQATAHNQALEFDSLAAALSYLQACLNGTILDTLRAHARPNLTSLPEPGYPEEPATEDTDDSEEVWEVIVSLLSNEREKRLAYLLFHCGLKAREVVQRCADEFSDVREVYRLRRNIMERLTRNADQLRWRLSAE
jgi:DNA-directed RNA polymerase specialized sigma24 family protein